MIDVSSFKSWLIDNKHLSGGAASSTCARVSRIAQEYDIEYEYVSDRCAELLEDLTYTAREAGEGVLPNVKIVIRGSYVKGLASLKGALKHYIEYLDATYKVSKKKVKRAPCYFEGDIDGFIFYVGPRWRNTVQTMTKSLKRTKGVCECCGARKTLEAAHQSGFERIDIIKSILKSNYEIAPDRYKVNLVEFEEKFKKAHEPLEDVFYFLCSKCHDDYDSTDSARSSSVDAAVKKNRGC